MKLNIQYYSSTCRNHDLQNISGKCDQLPSYSRSTRRNNPNILHGWFEKGLSCGETTNRRARSRRKTRRGRDIPSIWCGAMLGGSIHPSIHHRSARPSVPSTLGVSRTNWTYVQSTNQTTLPRSVHLRTERSGLRRYVHPSVRTSSAKDDQRSTSRGEIAPKNANSTRHAEAPRHRRYIRIVNPPLKKVEFQRCYKTFHTFSCSNLRQSSKSSWSCW